MFALLSYRTGNLGDEIQSLAARRFLPRVDLYVDRDALDVAPPGEEPVRLIMNGWFLHRPFRWPPHPRFRPLITAFHLDAFRPRRNPWRRTAADALLADSALDWLRRHGSVGARDPATERRLRERGVECHHSGCLTLTLQRPDVPRGDRIVACDLPDRLLAALARRTRQPPIAVSHVDHTTVGVTERMARAQALLDLYAQAKAVVTTRLHCALPCLAMGTPVLFIPNPRERERQEPALMLAHCAEPRDFLAARDRFDPEDPPPNREDFRPLADALVRECEAFVARADGTDIQLGIPDNADEQPIPLSPAGRG